MIWSLVRMELNPAPNLHQSHGADHQLWVQPNRIEMVSLSLMQP